MTAVTRAVTSATGGWPSSVPAVPLAGPAGETYPGGVNDTSLPGLNPGAHAQDYGPSATFAGPAEGDYPDAPLMESLGLDFPADLSGYGQGELTTTDIFGAAHPGAPLPAPYPVWDSSSGAPFAGSGPVGTPAHGADTGGVFWAQHVNTGNIGEPFRSTVTGQLTDRQSFTTDGRGFAEQAPGDRISLDQYQGNHWPGFDPHPVPFRDRENYLNIARVAQPGAIYADPYMPSADIPDMANHYPETSVAYSTPPDPYVSPSSLYVDTGIDGGWA